MIHPFVSEHLAEAIREHGLDLPWLTWLPYHAWDLGPCVAAEVGPGVRLVVRRPASADLTPGRGDTFQLEDHTTRGDVFTRSFEHIESVVRLLREWAAESVAGIDAAVLAYDLAVARDDGISGALEALGEIARRVPCDAPACRETPSCARRWRREAAEHAASGRAHSADSEKHHASMVAAADQATIDAARRARIRAAVSIPAKVSHEPPPF